MNICLTTRIDTYRTLYETAVRESVLLGIVLGYRRVREINDVLRFTGAPSRVTEMSRFVTAALSRRCPRVAGVVHARGGQENRVAVPVLPGRTAGGADADVQRSAVPAPVERQRLSAVFAELRHRPAGARGQLHTRGDRGQHGHRAAQHVPAKGAHRPQAVQHNRLSHGMAHFRMVKGRLGR